MSQLYTIRYRNVTKSGIPARGNHRVMRVRMIQDRMNIPNILASFRSSPFRVYRIEVSN